MIFSGGLRLLVRSPPLALTREGYIVNEGEDKKGKGKFAQ